MTLSGPFWYGGFGLAFAVGGRVKILALALLICAAWLSTASAWELVERPAGARLILADWQDPSSLPPRYRNHCVYDSHRGRYYCSNHCGLEYQFFYCSRESFGCCRIGYGYCGWKGLLRCAP